jgi:hypothetical protein
LTSARHDVFGKYLAEKYPESFDPAVPKDLIYSGSVKLTDKVDGSPLDAGKLVLSATRTYAPVIKKMLDGYRDKIHGIIHCSVSSPPLACCSLSRGAEHVRTGGVLATWRQAGWGGSGSGG